MMKKLRKRHDKKVKKKAKRFEFLSVLRILSGRIRILTDPDQEGENQTCHKSARNL